MHAWLRFLEADIDVYIDIYKVEVVFGPHADQTYLLICYCSWLFDWT